MKVGVLTTVPAVRAVARALAPVSVPRVVDPGFAPRSGVRLLRSTVVDALVRDLFPAAALVTLNLLEASVLAGFAIRSEADAKAAARRIQALGPSAVLVTGGCAEGPTVVDGLLDGRTWHRSRAPAARSRPACGAGGLLSAAVTAWLAAGETLPDAVARADRLRPPGPRRRLARRSPSAPDARSPGPGSGLRSTLCSAQSVERRPARLSGGESASAPGGGRGRRSTRPRSSRYMRKPRTSE